MLTFLLVQDSVLEQAHAADGVVFYEMRFIFVGSFWGSKETPNAVPSLSWMCWIRRAPIAPIAM